MVSTKQLALADNNPSENLITQQQTSKIFMDKMNPPHTPETADRNC